MELQGYTVKLPKGLMAEFRKACERQGEKRADVIRRLVAGYVGRAEPRVKKQGRPKAKRKKA